MIERFAWGLVGVTMLVAGLILVAGNQPAGLVVAFGGGLVVAEATHA